MKVFIIRNFTVDPRCVRTVLISINHWFIVRTVWYLSVWRGVCHQHQPDIVHLTQLRITQNWKISEMNVMASRKFREHHTTIKPTNGFFLFRLNSNGNCFPFYPGQRQYSSSINFLVMYWLSIIIRNHGSEFEPHKKTPIPLWGFSCVNMKINKKKNIRRGEKNNIHEYILS